MTEHEPPLSSDEIHQIKDQLMESWRRLSDQHRATMALVLLQEVIASDYGDWMRGALLITTLSIRCKRE